MAVIPEEKHMLKENTDILDHENLTYFMQRRFSSERYAAVEDTNEMFVCLNFNFPTFSKHLARYPQQVLTYCKSLMEILEQRVKCIKT